MLKARIQNNISTSTPRERSTRNILSFPIYTELMWEEENIRKQAKKPHMATPTKIKMEVKRLVNGIRKESEKTIRV